jgi:hypothetical protein
VQTYPSKSLDAGLLLLPMVGFLPPSDPRIIGKRRSSQLLMHRPTRSSSASLT